MNDSVLLFWNKYCTIIKISSIFKRFVFIFMRISLKGRQKSPKNTWARYTQENS